MRRCSRLLTNMIQMNKQCHVSPSNLTTSISEHTDIHFTSHRRLSCRENILTTLLRPPSLFHFKATTSKYELIYIMCWCLCNSSIAIAHVVSPPSLLLRCFFCHLRAHTTRPSWCSSSHANFNSDMFIQTVQQCALVETNWYCYIVQTFLKLHQSPWCADVYVTRFSERKSKWC